MKTCTYPECDKLTEGNTDYCGTHNRELRKQPRKSKFATRAIEGRYKRRVKTWKQGKICALKSKDSFCRGLITCHHKRGRLGDFLMDERYWLPVCMKHHMYIEDHPEESYKKGWSELRLSNEPTI